MLCIQVEQLQANVALLKAASLEADQATEELHEQLGGARSELKASQVEARNAHAQLSKTGEELEEARSIISGQQQQMASLEGQLAESAARVAGIERQKAELNAALAASVESTAKDKVPLASCGMRVPPVQVDWSAFASISRVY